MIIDIHMHFAHDIETKKIVEAARNAGIDKLCFLPLSRRGEALKYSYTSEEVKQIMDQHPEVVGFHPGSVTDPEGIEDLERSVKKYGFRGMKIHQEKNWRLEGLLACHALFRKAGELKIPVVIHPSTPIIDAELARSCPETTFIFAHAGYQWEEAFQAAKPYENACFDTSGYDAVAGVVERGVELLGAERIFFGSDAPVRNFASQLAKVQYADISKRDKRLILGENAARVLNLR
ncbi:MAG: amidohydrolase family protein [Nitrososphaerota archaeon]